MARQAEAQEATRRSARTRLLILVLVYAVPAIVSGIALMISSASLADEIWADPGFRQMMDDYGLVSSRDDVLEVVRYASKMTVISGACAAACAMLVHLGRFRMLATICCGAAALFCFWSVIGMVFGLFMTWRVFRSRPLFTNR